MGPLAVAPPHSLSTSWLQHALHHCMLPPRLLRNEAKQPWTNTAFPPYKFIFSVISKVTATETLSALSLVSLLTG